MNLLDHPLFWDLREMVGSGYFGVVGLLSVRLAHRGGLSWGDSRTNWRASRGRTGGGCFIQLAIHYEHVMRWTTGGRIRRVQAFVQNRACPHLEGDDLAMAHLEFDSGAYGDLQASWCLQEEHFSLMGTGGSLHYRENRTVEFIGEGGPFRGRVLRLGGNGKAVRLEPLDPPKWDDAGNPFNQHRRFFEALRTGKDPDVTGEDGREDVRVIQACYESAEKGRVIHL